MSIILKNNVQRLSVLGTKTACAYLLLMCAYLYLSAASCDGDVGWGGKNRPSLTSFRLHGPKTITNDLHGPPQGRVPIVQVTDGGGVIGLGGGGGVLGGGGGGGGVLGGGGGPSTTRPTQLFPKEGGTELLFKFKRTVSKNQHFYLT